MYDVTIEGDGVKVTRQITPEQAARVTRVLLLAEQEQNEIEMCHTPVVTNTN